MKRILITLMSVLILFMGATSCYTYTWTVGNGPQTGIEVKRMNHYLIYGLAPVGISDVNEMAGGAENYEVTIQHTFVDGLINAITLGIYSPTTTVVTK
jgi:hypothetical protein